MARALSPSFSRVVTLGRLDEVGDEVRDSLRHGRRFVGVIRVEAVEFTPPSTYASGNVTRTYRLDGTLATASLNTSGTASTIGQPYDRGARVTAEGRSLTRHQRRPRHRDPGLQLRRAGAGDQLDRPVEELHLQLRPRRQPPDPDRRLGLDDVHHRLD
jgi:hypothetical protein